MLLSVYVTKLKFWRFFRPPSVKDSPFFSDLVLKNIKNTIYKNKPLTIYTKPHVESEVFQHSYGLKVTLAVELVLKQEDSAVR